MTHKEKLSTQGGERRKFLHGAFAAGVVLPFMAGTETASAQPPTNNNKEVKTITARYDAARKYIDTHKNHRGIARVYFELQNKKGEVYDVVNIGALNTRSEDSEVTEEYPAYDILLQLGFKTVPEFAKKYNEIYSQRSEGAKNDLIQNAAKVELYREEFRRFQAGTPRRGGYRELDMLSGDKDFMNVRLALSVYVIDRQLQDNKIVPPPEYTYTAGGRQLKPRK